MRHAQDRYREWRSDRLKWVGASGADRDGEKIVHATRQDEESQR